VSVQFPFVHTARGEADLPVDCPECGRANRVAATFCGACGLRLPNESACLTCGSGNARGQSYCNMCGVFLAGGLALWRAGPGLATTTPTALGHPLPSPALLAVRARPSSLSPVAYAGLAGGFAVAAFVRFFRLDDIPPRLHQAEEVFLRTATSVTDRGWIGVWPESAEGQPAGLAYLAALWETLFGDGTELLRLGSATIGVATLGAFYLFCRSAFGPRPAVLGSLLLALAVWHLHYSRLALGTGPLLLLELATLYLLLTALPGGGSQARQRALLALAGVAFGATFYLHTAAFIFAAALAAIWLRELLAGDRPMAEVRRASLVFLIPAVVVAAPYLGSVATDSAAVSQQFRTVALATTQEYQGLPGAVEKLRHTLANAGVPLRTLAWRRDVRDGDRKVSRRLIDPITAALAALGLAAGLWRWRERAHFSLLALAAATVAGVAFTTESGMYGRLAVMVPAVFAYAGYALSQLPACMRGRVGDRTAYAVVVVLVALVAVHNLASFYSHPVSPTEAVWAHAGQLQ